MGGRAIWELMFVQYGVPRSSYGIACMMDREGLMAWKASDFTGARAWNEEQALLALIWKECCKGRTLQSRVETGIASMAPETVFLRFDQAMRFVISSSNTQRSVKAESSKKSWSKACFNAAGIGLIKPCQFCCTIRRTKHLHENSNALQCEFDAQDGLRQNTCSRGSIAGYLLIHVV